MPLLTTDNEEKRISQSFGTRMLRLPEVMSVVGLRRACIYKMQREGIFPKRIRIGVRAVGWLDSEIHAWLAKRAGRAVSPPPDPGSINKVPETAQETHPSIDTGEHTNRAFEPALQADELQRLRAIETRLRQIEELRAEIAELIGLVPDRQRGSARSARRTGRAGPSQKYPQTELRRLRRNSEWRRIEQPDQPSKAIHGLPWPSMDWRRGWDSNPRRGLGGSVSC